MAGVTPRLEPLEHTGADCIAWAQVNWRGGPRLGSVRYARSLMQDRRDAALMLFQMKLRRSLKPRGNYIRFMDLYPADDWRADL